jgi:hypothetical protein
MLDAKDIIVLVNDETKEVMVRTHAWGCPEECRGFSRGRWGDSIGASYAEWETMTDKQRMHSCWKRSSTWPCRASH